MSDILSTGLSGLLAFRRAIDTTSHNIANANTEGYVRQRTDFAARPGTPLASGWVGSGTDVQTITRTYDQYMVAATRNSSSSYERLNVLAAQAERINNLFADTQTGLSATLQKFNNSLQAVAAQPTSVAARQVLLGDAQATVDNLQYFDSRLRDFDQESSSRISSEVIEINSLAQGVARLNRDIASGYASTGQPPNDLLDQRDVLLDKLAAKINISLVPQDQGIVNVFVGQGQALVLNQTPAQLTTQPDVYDPTRPRIMLQGAQGLTDITSAVSGGTLGGIMDFRSQVLDPARNALGQIAAGFVDAVNSQHQKGMDLTGALGASLFSVGTPTVLSSSANNGSAGVALTRTDMSAVTQADYQFGYDGTNWSLRRLDTGASVTMTGAGTAGNPFVADGLSIVVSAPGSAVAGDRYLLRPTREAVAGLGVQITNPSRLAMAAPIRASAAAANTGGATVTQGEVLDATDAALRTTTTLQFLTPTTYSINGAGSFAYTSGQPIDVNGWRVAITGSPAVGDQFVVQDNASGVGDNRNALALANSLNSPRLDSATTSLSSAVSALAGSVGLSTQHAQINRDAQKVMLDDAATQRTNAMGVNLDEEAANLIRFQQAYQAAAQLIRVANDMFDAVIAATR
jgi:flagellar hook-associated protein 1